VVAVDQAPIVPIGLMTDSVVTAAQGRKVCEIVVAAPAAEWAIWCTTSDIVRI